ncbi:MAG: ATP-binding protein [Methanofollis sp.]|nr:ATP-binding protein [Methanofollis sp.]
MKIVVASGKGGTGKTTVSANLAYALARRGGVTLVDCDVEEPNLHLFFPGESEKKGVPVPVPAIDSERCTLCGECGHFCRYGALTVLKDRVLFFSELCHSCGGCTLVCPVDAITEVGREIGVVTTSHPLPGLTLISGVMYEGEVLAPKVIADAKEEGGDEGRVIYDASPGVACPVIETLEGADFCILVTESTPFGLHDLDLAVRAAAALGVAAGVVINRSDGEDDAAVTFCQEHDLPVLMTIPFDREVAAVQNRGGLIARDLPRWEERFAELWDEVARHCEVKV